MSGRDDEPCDIMRHHATSCDREQKRVGSGWRKMSFDRRRCGRETRWREWEWKAGGSWKWKRKTGGRRKCKGFPLQTCIQSNGIVYYCTDMTNSSCLVTCDSHEELDNSSKGRWTRDISQNTSKFTKKITYMVAPQGGKKFVTFQNHMGHITFEKPLLFRALHDP